MAVDTDGGRRADARPEWPVLAVACALSAASFGLVFTGRSNLFAVAAWPLSIAAFLWSVRPSRTGRPALRIPRADLLLAVLLPLVPVLVRVAFTSPYRIHGDELVTAYYSAHNDFSPKRFFDGVPQEGNWVCEFPSLFFTTQRLFFVLFGDGLAQVRASALPYVWLSGFALFLLGRRILGRAGAAIAVFLYATLAISVYIETTGLHFIAATGLFTAFFACAVRLFDEGAVFDAAAAGVVAGLCYLHYPSAYIALPVLGCLAIVAAVRARGVSRAFLARWVLWPLLGVVLAVAPFVPYAVKTRNYFTERGGQVLFLTESSPEVDALTPLQKAKVILPRNFANGLRSLVLPGYGGSGGYWFGQEAMFDRATAVGLALGFLGALVLARKRPAILGALFAIVLAFTLAIPLSQPPAGYHRMSVVHPLFGLVLAVPLVLLGRLVPSRGVLGSPSVRAAVAALAVAWLGSKNLARFSRIAAGEGAPEDWFLANWVNARYPDYKLYIAAFPGHAFEKVAYFARVRRKEPPLEQYHADLIRNLDEKEKYVYLMIFPESFEQRFRRADPKGHFALYGEWGVFVNDQKPGAS